MTVQKPKQTRKPGGGRKPLDPDDPTIARKITLTRSQWEHAEKLGNNNASAGIRHALNTTPK